PAAGCVDDEPGRRVGSRADVGDLSLGHAKRAESRRGPLALGDRLAIVALRLADVLLGNGLDLEQFLGQPQRPVSPLDVGDRLRIIRFGLAEVLTLDHEEGVARLDHVAGLGQHLHHAAGDRRVNAGDRFLVELHLAAGLEDAATHARLRRDDLDRHIGAARDSSLGWLGGRGRRRRRALTAGGQRRHAERDEGPPRRHHFSTGPATAASPVSISATIWATVASRWAVTRSTSAWVRAISPWLRSKILRGRLSPKPNVLSLVSVRLYSSCGVMSHFALARARATSALALSRAASAACRSGRAVNAR